MVLNSGGEANPSSDRPVPFHAGMWLKTTLYYLIIQAQAENSSSRLILGRLTELMFVEILRHYMEELAPNQKGWLAALKDPCESRHQPAACTARAGVDR